MEGMELRQKISEALKIYPGLTEKGRQEATDLAVGFCNHVYRTLEKDIKDITLLPSKTEVFKLIYKDQYVDVSFKGGWSVGAAMNGILLYKKFSDPTYEEIAEKIIKIVLENMVEYLTGKDFGGFWGIYGQRFREENLTLGVDHDWQGDLFPGEGGFVRKTVEKVLECPDFLEGELHALFERSKGPFEAELERLRKKGRKTRDEKSKEQHSKKHKKNLESAFENLALKQVSPDVIKELLFRTGVTKTPVLPSTRPISYAALSIMKSLIDAILELGMTENEINAELDTYQLKFIMKL